MQQFLKKLIVWLQSRAACRPAPARGRRACLKVEALEKRDVPSASPLSLPAPILASAKVGSFAPHTDSTGGTLGGIATPDRPVHGYKWRRPPWSYAGGTGGTLGEIAMPDTPVYGYKHRHRLPHAMDAQGKQFIEETSDSLPASLKIRVESQGATPQSKQVLAHLDAAFMHLATGGADGKTVFSSNGHVVVHPPEGPLPTEAKAAIG